MDQLEVKDFKELVVDQLEVKGFKELVVDQLEVKGFKAGKDGKVFKVQLDLVEQRGVV